MWSRTTTRPPAASRIIVYRCKASQIGEFARQLAEKIAAKTSNPALASVLGAAPKSDAHFDDEWIEECANDLAANPGRSIVTVGEQQPAWVQALVFAINEALGNHGATILGGDHRRKARRHHRRPCRGHHRPAR